MEEVLVFGHKNPDTDSICSSIAMAALKRKRGFDAIACCLGSLSKETEFVLRKLSVETPKMLKTVSAQVMNLNYVEKSTICVEDSIQEALELMTKENFSSLAVVDMVGNFRNMVHISEIANYTFSYDSGSKSLIFFHFLKKSLGFFRKV